MLAPVISSLDEIYCTSSWQDNATPGGLLKAFSVRLSVRLTKYSDVFSFTILYLLTDSKCFKFTTVLCLISSGERWDCAPLAWHTGVTSCTGWPTESNKEVDPK